MKVSLHTFPFRGIRADSLGGYLMGLGLLSACAKRWPDIRGCWREGCFNLLHKENNINIEEYIHGKRKSDDASENLPPRLDWKAKTDWNINGKSKFA